MRRFRRALKPGSGAAEVLACTYLCADGESFLFFDPRTFERFALPERGREALAHYLQEGGTYALLLEGDEPVGVRIPPKLVYTVVESEEGSRRGSLFGSTKPVTTETGLVVRVPLFIGRGERILVDTETNEFVERVSES